MGAQLTARAESATVGDCLLTDVQPHSLASQPTDAAARAHRQNAHIRLVNDSSRP